MLNSCFKPFDTCIDHFRKMITWWPKQAFKTLVCITILYVNTTFHIFPYCKRQYTNKADICKGIMNKYLNFNYEKKLITLAEAVIILSLSPFSPFEWECQMLASYDRNCISCYSPRCQNSLPTLFPSIYEVKALGYVLCELFY